MVLDGRNINFSKVKLANSYNIPSQPSLGPSYPINSKATIPRSEATNGNLQQFFVSSLELARHIFQAAAAHIFCSEDAEFNFQIGLGWELPRLDRDFYLYQATLTQDAVLWLEDMATEAKICLDDVLHKWGIRFWAGIPLTNSRGKKVGILCVFDTQPHQFNVDHQRLLLCLKVQIELQFKLNHEVLSVHKALEELETQNRYLNLLEQLSASLSGCATQKEICQVISCQISQLFPNSYGYIQLFKQPEQELQELLQWGKSYQETDHDFDAYPLLIEQKLLGNIYFCPNYFIDRAPYGDEVLSKFLEQVSRALYNVALFQALQLQSIKDPLTGLFNRRYMTEVLEQLLPSQSKNT
jgi:GAF domain-containing protein